MRIRDTGLVALLLTLSAPLQAAYGTFSSAPAPPAMTVASATLAAPATAAAANGACVVAVSRTVNVSWEMTASTFADGYLVLRATATGGPYNTVATITSRLTTVWADTTVAESTTYYYRVQATKLAWRSDDSPTASITTPSILCVL